MADVKRPIKIFNGTEWDKILPEVSEDMINGGFTQSLGALGGYKKNPGGMIIQWGSVGTTTMSQVAANFYKKSITYPIAFSTSPVVATTFNFNQGVDKHGIGSNTRFGCEITSGWIGGGCNVLWIAIGY